MDPKLAIDAAAFLVAFLVAVASLIVWIVRTAAESEMNKRASGLMEKIDDVGGRLIGRIDALKDEVAAIATGLRVSEERHANLVRETERLGSRIDRLEPKEPAQHASQSHRG